MLIHPGLEVFVVQLDRADVVIEVPFPRDGSHIGVVAHKLNVHEPPGRQVKHGPPHHDGFIPFSPPWRIDGHGIAAGTRLVPLVLRALPAGNQVVVDDAVNQGTVLLMIY